MRSSTWEKGRPAERSRLDRGPSGSWSSGMSDVMAPVVSVSPYTWAKSHPSACMDFTRTSSLMGEAP